MTNQVSLSLLFTVCRTILTSLTVSSTSFLTRSVQLIFSSANLRLSATPKLLWPEESETRRMSVRKIVLGGRQLTPNFLDCKAKAAELMDLTCAFSLLSRRNQEDVSGTLIPSDVPDRYQRWKEQTSAYSSEKLGNAPLPPQQTTKHDTSRNTIILHLP